MAWLTRRVIFQLSKRSFSNSAVLSLKPKDQFPDPLELATGLEKRELLAAEAGNFDPYYMKALEIKRHTTKDDPNLVPSVFHSRIIGCVCEEDACHVNWMWLHAGTARRCECGHWFKLVEKPPIM